MIIILQLPFKTRGQSALVWGGSVGVSREDEGTASVQRATGSQMGDTLPPSVEDGEMWRSSDGEATVIGSHDSSDQVEGVSVGLGDVHDHEWAQKVANEGLNVGFAHGIRGQLQPNPKRGVHH